MISTAFKKQQLPCPLSEWILHALYADPKNDKQLIERTKKYTVVDFLLPVRYKGIDEEYEFKEYLKLLVLYNTEDSQYYIGKYGATSDWSFEDKAFKILAPLNCPHIIRLVDRIVPSFAARSLLIMPKYNQFDMEVLKNFPKQVVFQLITVLKIVHKNNIVHWDVSMDNIVWEWNGSVPHIYLIDFDSSHDLTKPCTVLKYKYSVGYGPVGDKGRYEDGRRGYPADDMWAVGVILAELLLGRTKRAFIDYPRSLPYTTYILSQISHCDPLAVDLVTKLLTETPTSRLTARRALKHPYFDELRSEVNNKSKKRKLIWIRSPSKRADNNLSITSHNHLL